jgi:hypothetical protein
MSGHMLSKLHQIVLWDNKTQNPKHQITNKSQISISNDQNNHCVGTDRIEKLALPIINVLELLQLNKNIDIFEAITYSSAME